MVKKWLPLMSGNGNGYVVSSLYQIERGCSSMQEFLRENGQVIMIVIVVAILVALVVALGPTVSSAIKESFNTVTSYGNNITMPTINPGALVN